MTRKSQAACWSPLTTRVDSAGIGCWMGIANGVNWGCSVGVVVLDAPGDSLLISFQICGILPIASAWGGWQFDAVGNWHSLSGVDPIVANVPVRHSPCLVEAGTHCGAPLLRF